MARTPETEKPTVIPRHKIENKKWFAKRYDLRRRVLDVSLAAVGSRPDNLSSIVDIVSELLSCALVMDESKQTIRSYLQIGARAGLASFHKLAAGNQSIVVDLGRGPIEISGSPKWVVSSGAWVFGYYFAVLAREPATITGLAAVSPKLFKMATTSVPGYKDLYAEALVHFENKSRKLGPTLERCLKMLPEETTNPSAALVFKSEAELFRAFLRAYQRSWSKWEEDFQTVLIASLQAYQRFLEINPALKKGQAGVVALRPLGLAALAHDRGIPIWVESEFIPAFLVKGEFAD